MTKSENHTDLRRYGYMAVVLFLLFVGGTGCVTGESNSKLKETKNEKSDVSREKQIEKGGEVEQKPLSYDEIRNQTFERMDRILAEKKTQLSEYLDRISRNAESITEDEIMLKSFSIMNQYNRLQKREPPPPEIIQSIEKLKENVKDQYLRNYLAFYDILFVDKDGEIFYTIRQEPDYKQNLFHGKLANTALSEQLRKNPEKTFVDYQYYSYSDEPSAFIAIPIFKDNSFDGWVVFQCAINKINNMFTADKNLGSTGEVFLVNRQNYMLTDSRFYGDTSILKKMLSRENIEAKFKEKSGHKSVIDYRGFSALSSFDVFEIGKSEWLIVVKIDEDEVLTEYYNKRRKAIRKDLLSNVADYGNQECELSVADKKLIEVDMDEYRKATSKEIIKTQGVSTCTALIVAIPGRFSYMAHISNLDVSYGGNTTDLLGHILKQIETFDIYRYEIRYLQITVVANHFDSIENIVIKLMDEGIFLSQIKFIYNDKAEYATVLHDYEDNETKVSWLMDRDTGDRLQQCGSKTVSIGEMVKKIATGF